ncbi:hypothetical protein FAGKG844_60140 [Frankia sp. AgKG'84/4]
MAPGDDFGAVRTFPASARCLLATSRVPPAMRLSPPAAPGQSRARSPVCPFGDPSPGQRGAPASSKLR